MTLRSITNNVSFRSMGKLAYKTNKVMQNGLPVFVTQIKKGGVVTGEICRCKESGSEFVYGYKKQGGKLLFFQSFFDMIRGKHVISIRYKEMLENKAKNGLISVRYNIPWKVNDKKVPSFKDFFKIKNTIKKLKTKDVTNEVL